MALNPPIPGLRVFHNSNTAQRFTITVPAGAELTVPHEVAAQMNLESSHAEIDADALAKARADALDRAEAERVAALEPDATDETAKPRKAAAAKKSPPKPSSD